VFIVDWFGDFFLKNGGTFRKADGTPQYRRIVLLLMYIGLLVYSLVAGSIFGYVLVGVIPLGVLELRRRNVRVKEIFLRKNGDPRYLRIALLLMYIALVANTLATGTILGYVLVGLVPLGVLEQQRRAKQKADKRLLIAKARRENLTKRPEYLGPYLLPSEGKVRWEDTKDPIVVLPWKFTLKIVAPLVFVLGSVGSIVSANVAPVLFGLVVALGAASLAGWKILVWRSEWRAITSGSDARLIVITGVISKKVAYVKISDIKTASYTKPAGRRIGGIDAQDFIVDSPAQDDQVKTIPFVRGRDVNRVSEYLNE
jgi:hypothetical protein